VDSGLEKKNSRARKKKRKTPEEIRGDRGRKIANRESKNSKDEFWDEIKRAAELTGKARTNIKKKREKSNKGFKRRYIDRLRNWSKRDQQGSFSGLERSGAKNHRGKVVDDAQKRARVLRGTIKNQVAQERGGGATT